MSTDRDELFDIARELVLKHHWLSISILQRCLHLGLERAGRLRDQLEEAGVDRELRLLDGFKK